MTFGYGREKERTKETQNPKPGCLAEEGRVDRKLVSKMNSEDFGFNMKSEVLSQQQLRLFISDAKYTPKYKIRAIPSCVLPAQSPLS